MSNELETTDLVVLQNRIIIRPDKPQEVTEAGIVLAGADKNKSDRGLVLGIGPGRLLDDGTLVPMTVQVGDKVIFSRQNPMCHEVEYNNENLMVIIEDEIIGIIR